MAFLHGGGAHMFAPEVHNGFPDTRLEVVWFYIHAYAPAAIALLSVAIVLYIVQHVLRSRSDGRTS